MFGDTDLRRGCTWKYNEVTASLTLCRWCHIDGSWVLTTTKEPDCVPATSQSEASSGIWTVTRQRTGLVSISCRSEKNKHENAFCNKTLLTVCTVFIYSYTEFQGKFQVEIKYIFSAVGTCVVTLLVSRSTAVMEPSRWVLLPPPSQALWLIEEPSPLPELTVKHSALKARGTTDSLIRHNISPEFSLSNTCTHHRTQKY